MFLLKNSTYNFTISFKNPLGRRKKKTMFKTHLHNIPEKKNSHVLMILIEKSYYKYISYSNNIYYANRESINIFSSFNFFSFIGDNFWLFFNWENVTVIEILFEMFCSKKKVLFFSYYDYYIEYTIDPMKPEPFEFYMHMDM